MNPPEEDINSVSKGYLATECFLFFVFFFLQAAF